MTDTTCMDTACTNKKCVLKELHDKGMNNSEVKFPINL